MASNKPSWLKVPLAGGDRYRQVRQAVSSACLSTVCEEARCPNIGECWNSGTATFMILGDTCTRGCAFCAVNRGDPRGHVDLDEPSRLASAVASMGLDYVVITSVTRDNLSDGGAGIFARCVAQIGALPSEPLVELLTPDYLDDNLRTVLDAAPAVFAHNVETVERLTPSMRHPRFSYARSLKSLAQAATFSEKSVVKSSIMLGAGETRDEVTHALQDLLGVGVQILVLGQYLQPTRGHASIVEFIPPQQFEDLRAQALEMGFGFVAAGPLVRTSYRAAEAFVQKRFRGDSHG